MAWSPRSAGVGLGLIIVGLAGWAFNGLRDHAPFIVVRRPYKQKVDGPISSQPMTAEAQSAAGLVGV